MSKLYLYILSLGCFTAVAFAGNSTRGQSVHQTFTVQESNAEEVIVSVHPQVYRETYIEVDGKRMKQYHGMLSGMTAEAGKPELPVEGFLVATPPGTEPSIDILESKYATEQTTEIAPAPSYTRNKLGDAVAHYHIDKSFYATQTQYYPQQGVQLGEVARIRDLSAVKVIVHPLQYNIALGQIKRTLYLKVRIRFKANSRQSVQAARIPVTDPDLQFEPVYKNSILNYHEAASWRSRDPLQLQSVQTDSTALWFQTGRPYYRIPIISDGIYRLNYSELLGYGIDMTLLNNATAAVYYKGYPVPVSVQTSDPNPQNWYLEFFAHQNYGDSTYLDIYDDTSAYWLTWNDQNPKQMTFASVSPPGPADTVHWYMQNFWREVDENYFFGVTDDDIENTEVDSVPGKGWYWTTFLPGQSNSLYFGIDTVQRNTGVPVQITAKFWGMTECAPGGGCAYPSRDEATISINGVQLGTIDWIENTEAIFHATCPDTVLKKGGNLFTVASKLWAPSDSNISEFYIAWFQVKYPHPLLVSKGTLNFTATPSPTNSYSAFLVNGLSKDSATVMDLTDGRIVQSLTKLTSTSFVVTDTLTVPHNYFVINASSRLKPDTLIGKTFQNLRLQSRGADYIVITHSLFETDANRLAQFRHTQDKLRTAVIDVQDIYDEFNYGQLDPVSLRKFLKYAYYNWTHPSPTYVLFFGGTTWDFKRNLPTSTKLNYVPSYGNPPSDNALVCFDTTTTYIPYMLVGRVPVESTATASSVVDKIIGYDAPPSGTWDKNGLFITGGDDQGEQFTFDYYSDNFVNLYWAPYPIGGTTTKVYKSTNAIIDGENESFLQQTIQNGVVFVNFIGHSGGRIWDVNIGSPSQLQNTNGYLPFVSSVSCNVGFFSDPDTTVLSEDFMNANNRGAIGVWSSASVGYASVGNILVDKFLSMATQNYARNFGIMTTLSRLQFWIDNDKVGAPLVTETEHLTPLLGDPYSNLAIPVLPDFDVEPSGISVLNSVPTSDSTLTLRIHISNLGLMAGSPVLISVHDTYTDEQGHTNAEQNIVPPFYRQDFVQQDSFYIGWNVQGKPGNHLVTVRIDPLDSIPESQKSNNIAQQTFYVFRNAISAVNPIPNSLISGMTPNLVVTTPAGSDTTLLTYTYQLDTTSVFSSPALVTSGAIQPGKVSASWQPPALTNERTYYWRAQTNDGQRQGAWSTSSFKITSSAPRTPDTTHWQQSGRQLANTVLLQGASTDSGIVQLRTDSTQIYVRSLGYRENPNDDYYSVISIGNVIAYGLWWEDPYSYLAGWFNPVDGSYQLNGYDLLVEGEVDSMSSFLASIPNGYYVMLSVVIDPQQNATDSLYQQIEQLGSTLIQTVSIGQSWMMISRKGVQMPIVESYQPNGVAQATVMVGNVYHSGPALVYSQPIGPATRWRNTSFSLNLPNANAGAILQVLGIRTTNAIDTLMTLAQNTFSADLSAVNPTVYPQIQLYARLYNTDGSSSPTLKQWDVEYLPPPDLAISPWSFHVNGDTIQSGSQFKGSLTVYNIGYRMADSAHVSTYLMDDTTQRFDTMIDTLAEGSQRTIAIAFTLNTSAGLHNIVARVQPESGTNDLLSQDNTASHTVYVNGSSNASQNVKVYFDGIQIRNGDYVSAKPVITIEYPATTSAQSNPYEIFIDGKDVSQITGSSVARTVQADNALMKLSFTHSMSNGEHVLEVHSAISPQAQPISKLRFQVSSVADVQQVLNYPNPFSSQTLFTFTITGSQLPQQLYIKVFTVAGRLIRTLPISVSELRMGFNKISWDGRDQQGDEIANGTYFYKIVMHTGTESVEKVERLVKAR
jgi:hypothetical protein